MSAYVDDQRRQPGEDSRAGEKAQNEHGKASNTSGSRLQRELLFDPVGGLGSLGGVVARYHAPEGQTNHRRGEFAGHLVGG